MATPQYNGIQYNEAQYGFAELALNLFDTVTPSDATITKVISLSLTDTQVIVDVLAKAITMAALTESVGSSDDDNLGSLYNIPQYNTIQYGIGGSGYGFMKKMIVTKSEAITSTDTLVTEAQKLFTEAISSGDTLIKNPMPRLTESVFMAEIFQREISNEALNDEIKIADWIIIERKPIVRPW